MPYDSAQFASGGQDMIIAFPSARIADPNEQPEVYNLRGPEHLLPSPIAPHPQLPPPSCRMTPLMAPPALPPAVAALLRGLPPPFVPPPPPPLLLPSIPQAIFQPPPNALTGLAILLAMAGAAAPAAAINPQR